jgi:hypothetical protein
MSTNAGGGGNAMGSMGLPFAEDDGRIALRPAGYKAAIELLVPASDLSEKRPPLLGPVLWAVLDRG